MLLQGIAVSPGIAIGPIYIVDPEEIEVQDGNLAKGAIPREKERFKNAIRESIEEVREIREKIALETGEEQARILDAQIDILEDPEAQKQTLAVIEKERKPAAFAYRRILTAVAARLDEADSEYYRGRAIDVRDVRRRMLAHLGGIRTHSLHDLKEPSVIVANDLPPSEMALLPRNMALGFATDAGGRTSHTAIMARARGIPAVVGVKGATDAAQQGAIGIVDGTRGVAIFDPDPGTLQENERKRERHRELALKLTELRTERCMTADGRVIELGANLEVPEELPSVIENGADGIGLYRTEFFYLSRKQLPTEDAQFNAYRSIVEAMNPKPVNIRTLDVGGDKFASYLGTPIEKNPFLGLRGLRFSLLREEIFRTQLRAIFRASAYGNLRIMFPMVLGLEDLRRAREIVERVRLQIRKEGIPMGQKVPLGVMIETPASVFSIDQLVKECDFASIGTNDLIQYTLAVDRGNELISEIYEPLHPAVIRAIHTVVDAGHRAGIPVGICGEMAGEPLYAVLLVGLGLEEFSVSPYLVPEIKTIVRATTYPEARELAERCMSLSTPSEVRTVVTEFMSRRYPGIIVPA
ncbi:MAG TPA: phosphoenolpyruvate--protein phosphotransferase [Candidatus Dormibacteraeota bacterium]|nr:phosphoenolpyruvate--protein phosphotransferase [Candidatus Dormibacteraeota bacterium]